MKLIINNKQFETEALAYLKVFYPLDEIGDGKGQQPFYKLSIIDTDITVAYFNGEVMVQEASLGQIEQAIYQALDGLEKRRVGKRLMKQLIYDIATVVTGIYPPWGILMGIRPTKLASNLVEVHGDKTLDVLMTQYRLKEEKARILLEVVEEQNKSLDISENKHSVYVGIPFCPSRCSYCSFTSYSCDKFREAYDAYTESLIKEMEAFPEAFSDIRSIYIGGGTPTSLTDDDFELLLSRIRKLMGDQAVEFTVEAGRPDTISQSKLESMKRYGVNRLSINPQTMHNHTLQKIGRQHDVKTFIEVYDKARSMGFDFINMDLILGLPEESVEDVEETIHQILELNPESITIHTMALKRGTALTDQRRQYLEAMTDRISMMLDVVYEKLKDSEYRAYYLYRQKNMIGNYENIGYAKAEKACIYNIHTMEELESIIAFGAGSISKRVNGKKIKRLDQGKDVKVYLSHPEKIIETKRAFFAELI